MTDDNEMGMAEPPFAYAKGSGLGRFPIAADRPAVEVASDLSAHDEADPSSAVRITNGTLTVFRELTKAERDQWDAWTKYRASHSPAEIRAHAAARAATPADPPPAKAPAKKSADEPAEIRAHAAARAATPADPPPAKAPAKKSADEPADKPIHPDDLVGEK